MIVPGLLVLLFFTAYAMYVGVKEKVARRPFDLKEVLASANDLKWEMFIPVIMGVGIVVLQRRNRCVLHAHHRGLRLQGHLVPA